MGPELGTPNSMFIWHWLSSRESEQAVNFLIFHIRQKCENVNMTQTNKPLARAFSDPKKFNRKGKKAAPGATRRTILEGVTGGLCQSRRAEREQGRGGKFLFKLQTHTTSQDAWELPLSLLSPNDKGQEREPVTHFTWQDGAGTGTFINQDPSVLSSS